MVKRLFAICIVYIAFFIAAFPMYAGGGRFRLDSPDSPGFVGTTGLHIQAGITNDTQNSMSVGEKAEFRIQNPRAGDRCDTTTNVTTNFGQIFGVCYVDHAGQILVYVHSFDRNEDSSPYVLYFYDKPTSIPTTGVYPTSPPQLEHSPTVALLEPSAVVTERNRLSSSSSQTPSVIEPTIIFESNGAQRKLKTTLHVFFEHVFNTFLKLLGK